MYCYEYLRLWSWIGVGVYDDCFMVYNVFFKEKYLVWVFNDGWIYVWRWLYVVVFERLRIFCGFVIDV